MERVGAFVTGVRKEPYQPEAAHIQNLLRERRDVKKQLGALDQQDVDARDPRYRKLSARQKALEWEVHTTSVKKGDAKPYFPNAKPPHPVDIKVQELEAKSKAMRAANKAHDPDNPHMMSVEYQALRDRITALKKQKGPAPSRLKRRPLTPAERSQKRIDRMVERAANPTGAAEERLNRMLERAGAG